MSSISVADGYFTLFNIFHTDGPEGQRLLFDQWRGLPPANVQPGLVSGNFHRGFDGLSVVNYAQWESKEAYDAFLSERATQGRLGSALNVSRLDTIPCEVVHTWDPAPRISLDTPRFTVVIVVGSAPEDQAEVLKEMTYDPPELATTPGYVSHAVHRGLTGEHVVKYAQWEDEKSFRAFLERPQKPSPLDELGVEVQLYFGEIEYIRERS
ncbi:heme-degrading monooxygenase HmoA [Streptomyces sp. SAI-144]|jgi:heme-degrading monooxygenase HmoA|uniref:antibiotic biosynthesis monooxygenase family protein n=1 Tax=unclassified Streptomyces TaxID=2593676 RepID=UPI0024759E91|nr:MULTISPECIES: antibiotic biosynthesis monooxygenase [unclassified Streptomyces]MDH6435206.1 heme-degrading monooxygenase HmoA [Streptomyces sp. SAI-144]MDH6489342.1 heme-degrading monooxygenase HmoA [Streptomyces sp. SAI-127]